MDGSAGVVALTVCLGIGGALFRMALRSDAAERRRHPPERRAPEPLPRDPRIRTAGELSELFTRAPSMPDTEPRDRIPPQPRDTAPAAPPRPAHIQAPRTDQELRDLLAPPGQ